MIKTDHVIAIGAILILVFALGFAMGCEAGGQSAAISIDELPVQQPCERPNRLPQMERAF